MITANDEIRVGVYVCHCGTNISSVVDVLELSAFAEGLPRVVLARDTASRCAATASRSTSSRKTGRRNTTSARSSSPPGSRRSTRP